MHAEVKSDVTFLGSILLYAVSAAFRVKISPNHLFKFIIREAVKWDPALANFNVQLNPLYCHINLVGYYTKRILDRITLHTEQLVLKCG